MQYPLKKTYTLYLTIRIFWYEKIIRLEIPQATIRDLSEFYSLTDHRKSAWIIIKLREWGAGKYSQRLAAHLGKNIESILSDTFFSKKPFDRLPESVISLSNKEGIYDYDSPDSVLFATIATEYGIEPQKLLDYTMDELSYLLIALQYKYLNEDQKKELQRIKKVEEFKRNKTTIDSEVDLLLNYFEHERDS